MQISPHVGMQQRQSTVLAAQQIQSIKLLQYGVDELQAFLADQAERNPLVEIVCGNGLNEQRDHTTDTDTSGARDDGDRTDIEIIRFPAQRRDLTAGDGFTCYSQRSARAGSGSNSNEANPVEDMTSATVSLADHLREQAGVSFERPAERIIAAEIIGSLDPDGYLRRRLTEIADALGAREVLVEAVLKTVQAFDPIGVGARDLAECLRLQLDEAGKLDRAMTVLLGHLPLLGRYDLPQLARICEVDVETVRRMAKDIRELDPRPGRRFDTAPMLPALPDVLVELRPDGSATVEINSSLLPRVLVNQRYYAGITAGPLEQQQKVFVTNCLRNANWLAKNVEQRAQTILRVATEIVVQQRAFLLHGVTHLRPMTLKDVAKALSMHESTVCRATANKYIMTGRGMFELKFFFSNAISGADGEEDFAAETIRHKIRQMISTEAITRVMSDDAIVKALRRDGVDIARRTVAKYREMMNIGSSSRRRRQKQSEQVEPPVYQGDFAMA